MVHNQLQAKDDCWRIDALYKLQPNKVHSKKMQYMKVHHGEVHHKEVHHEEVQLNTNPFRPIVCVRTQTNIGASARVCTAADGHG